MTAKIKIRIEALSDIIAALAILLIFAAILTGSKIDFKKANAGPVTVETKDSSASDITAILAGTINPNSNVIISRGFEWGLNTSYGSNSDDSSIYQPQFKNSWPTSIKPNAVAIKSDGSYAVLNTEASKVITYDALGNQTAELGGQPGNGNYEFNSPKAIAYTKNGNLLVADTQNSRIQIYNSNLAYSGTISDAALVKPSSLYIDFEDKLYALDEQNNRLQKFNSNYSSEALIGEGRVIEPASVSVDVRSNIYISDKNGIQIFTSNGNFTKTFGSEKFNSTAVDSKGNILALNSKGEINIFSDSGQLLTTFGGVGIGDGLFSNPSGLSINQDDTLLVGDTGNFRVQKFTKQDSTTPTDYSLPISNLTCKTDYHYRAYAKTSEGTYYGNDATFSTLPCGMRSASMMNAMSMTIQTNDPSAVGLFSATFNGEVSASSSPITKRGFEWGTTASFGSFIAGEATETSRKINPGPSPWPIASNLPSGIAVDKNSQKVYVSDPNNNLIKIYDFAGNLTGTYNPGTLNNPNGLAVDVSGRIYIADSGNDRILVINSDLTVAGSMGGTGVNPENLNNPHGVALDTGGNVYVADSGNDMVKRYNTSFAYDPTGSFGSTGSGGTGQFINPLGIAIAQEGGNKIIVADTGNSRYQVFEQAYTAPSTQTPVTTPSLIIDGTTSGTAFNAPASVAVDVKNNVYVADTGNHRVVIFRQDGGFTSTYGSIADFNSPYGVATYTQPDSNPINNNSMLFVTDQNNSEVENFLTQGEFSASAFSNTIDYLNCGTTYYYRALAANSDGNYIGDTKSFSTTPCNTNITATTLPPSNITGTFATLNGNISSVGDAQLKIQGFQWGSSTSYGNTLNNQSATNQNDATYLDLATQWNSTLNSPLDSAVDSEGSVYISDYGNNKIKKFNNNGGFITEWSVTEPRGIGIRLDYIWVANQGGISKYQKDGTFIANFTEGIGATDVAADNSENMYATFPEGFVKVISSGGALTNIWGNHDPDPSYNLGYSPTGIDLFDYGSYVVIYVADTTKNRIIKYSGPDGTAGGTIGGFGSEKGNLILPGFLTINQTNEDVFVTDSTGALSKFSATGTTTYYKTTINDMVYGTTMASILSGVALDSNGNIFTTNAGGNLVRKFYQRGSATALGNYSRVLGQLNCGSTYNYRAYASNGTTNFYGVNQTVKTTDCNLIPVISNPIPFGAIPIGIFSSAQPNGGAGNIPPNSLFAPQGRSGIVGAIDNALQGILNITKRVPRDVAVAIPFLLILIILFFALIYAIQSYRELKSTERYNTLIEKYDNLQFGSKNFIALTNHYLNTPISIMQLSADLLLSVGIITKEKSTQINTLMHNITNSVHELLEKNAKTTEKFMSDINPEILQKKIRRASFNPLAWIPIIIAGLLVILANLLFLRADVFRFNYASLIVQVGLFILSALFILLAWRSLNRNREIRKQRAITLQKEKELSAYKINFINEASASIDKNIVSIKEISEEFNQEEKAKSFMRGVAMLSGVQKSFELLKKFSAFSPTGNIDEDDVNDVLSKILERQTKVLERKNLKIKTNVANELNMRLDKSALILLLGSTINNAVKFSKDDGTVYVNVENKINGSKIAIRDEGIGIPKDKIDQLMMPFTRASDAMQYDYEGLGLGLYLDRIIIEQIGGSIKITSEIGKGTTIEFNIPRGIKEHSAKPQKAALKTQQIRST